MGVSRRRLSEECTPGRFADNFAAKRCARCPAGKWSSSVRAEMCVPCNGGRFGPAGTALAANGETEGWRCSGGVLLAPSCKEEDDERSDHAPSKDRAIFYGSPPLRGVGRTRYGAKPYSQS